VDGGGKDGGKDGVDGEGNGRSGGNGAELGWLEAGGWLGVGKVGSRDLRHMAKGICFAAGQLWTGDGGEAWQTGDGGNTESGWLQVDSSWTVRIDDGGDTLWTGSGGSSGTKVGCFGVGGSSEMLQAGSSGDTENEQWIAGMAEVGGVGVASAQQGHLGRPSDGGRATRSKTGDGTGVGAVDRAGALAARSVSGVSTLGMGGEDALAGGEGAGGASELWAVDCGSGLCRMSQICCLKLGGKLAWTSG